MHEPPAATADMAVLPGVLGSRTQRRTDKYASGPSPCGCPVARPSPRSRDGVSCITQARVGRGPALSTRSAGRNFSGEGISSVTGARVSSGFGPRPSPRRNLGSSQRRAGTCRFTVLPLRDQSPRRAYGGARAAATTGRSGQICATEQGDHRIQTPSGEG